MGPACIKSCPWALLNIQSTSWSRGVGWWEALGLSGSGLPREGSPSEGREAGCQEGDGSIRAQLCWAKARDPTPPTLCRPRPGQSPAGTACLISNNWAAFVALPNFRTLCAYPEILNCVSSLPFNKFFFFFSIGVWWTTNACLNVLSDEKVEVGCTKQVRKLTSERQIPVFWLDVGKQSVYCSKPLKGLWKYFYILSYIEKKMSKGLQPQQHSHLWLNTIPSSFLALTLGLWILYSLVSDLLSSIQSRDSCPPCSFVNLPWDLWIQKHWKMF